MAVVEANDYRPQVLTFQNRLTGDVHVSPGVSLDIGPDVKCTGRSDVHVYNACDYMVCIGA